MELILLRHGTAEDSHTEGDYSRALVEKGRKQSRKAARLLKQAGKLPEIVLTSPLTRARQTADEFCETAGLPGPVVQGWLACGMDADTALKELVGFREFERLAIVGHEPDFSSFIECLLGVSGGSIKMKKGGLACIRINPPARYATLLYLIPPKLADEAND